MEEIHDVSFNHYGNRFVAAGQSLKIYALDEKKWVKQDEIKIEQVQQVKWADPQFGSVIGVLYAGKLFSLFEEKKSIDDESKWVQRNTLTLQDRVVDMKFGAKRLGLVIALVYLQNYMKALADGTVKIMRMLDSQLVFTQEQIGMFNCYGVATLSWNKSEYYDEMIAVGLSVPDDQVLKSISNNDADQKNSIRVASQGLGTSQQITPTILKSTVQIWSPIDQNTWGQIKSFDIFGYVNDISWAPLIGRSYHLIAIAEQNGVRVIKWFYPNSYEVQTIEYKIVKMEVIKKLVVRHGIFQEQVWQFRLLTHRFKSTERYSTVGKQRINKKKRRFNDYLQQIMETLQEILRTLQRQTPEYLKDCYLDTKFLMLKYQPRGSENQDILLKLKSKLLIAQVMLTLPGIFIGSAYGLRQRASMLPSSKLMFSLWSSQYLLICPIVNLYLNSELILQAGGELIQKKDEDFLKHLAQKLSRNPRKNEKFMMLQYLGLEDYEEWLQENPQSLRELK